MDRSIEDIRQEIKHFRQKGTATIYCKFIELSPDTILQPKYDPPVKPADAFLISKSVAYPKSM